MFWRSRELGLLELEMERAIRDLRNHAVGSSEYVRTLDQIVKIHRIKTEEKPEPVKRDTLVLAGTNLMGILMIIKHEYVNVITSRATNLILKPR